MKMDTGSWHFRVYKRWLQLKTRRYRSTDLDSMLWYAKNTGTHNLCLYMRVVMFWGPIKIFFFSVPAVLSTAIMLLLGLIYLELTATDMWLFIGISDFLLILLGAGLLLVLSTFIVMATEGLRNRFGKKEKKEKKPNIVWEYLKAKKQKICPILSFDDE